MPSDWERVAADPRLLAALRRRAAGPTDPLDRLWWAEHPGAPTPQGLPDPALRTEDARRALYRKGAARSEAVEAERAADAAAASLRALRRDLAAAEEEVRGADGGGGTRAAVRPARRVLIGAVVAAVLIGAAAGWAAGRFGAPPHAAALTVFDRAQRADDRFPTAAEPPRAVDPGSTRFIGSSSASGTSVYAARASGDRVCLLAVVLAQHVVGSCTTEGAFAEAGLELSFPTSIDPQDDSGPAPPQELTPHWTPDGRLTF
ncbi:hypothetical protein GCM10025783_30900 [Amnibacterium soli]|uniref:Uncharacterized protein n=1 Tax=Amnibacterium soli TaxID=1282736 RepID=A0ABP8ZG94_9MICO